MNSKLGIYYQINPSLTNNHFTENIMEYERLLISRYRTGSHYLNIEKLRWVKPPIARENRLCICNNGVQDINHIIFHCDKLNAIRNFNIQTIDQFFQINSLDIYTFFKKAQTILSIYK